jgi:hypothetical protein
MYGKIDRQLFEKAEAKQAYHLPLPLPQTFTVQRSALGADRLSG